MRSLRIPGRIANGNYIARYYASGKPQYFNANDKIDDNDDDDDIFDVLRWWPLAEFQRRVPHTRSNSLGEFDLACCV